MSRFLILVLIFCLVAICAPSAQAISFGGLGIRPAYPEPSQPLTRSWFIYQLAAGESKEDAVIVSNNSSGRIKAKLYPVDATTTKDGAFALLGEKDSQQGIGAWVRLDSKEIDLAAGEEKIIPFKITLPAKLKAGDYAGGIVVENLTGKEDKGINMVTRVGVRIYETVPGQSETRQKREFAYLSSKTKGILTALLVLLFLVLARLLYSRRQRQL